MAFKRLSLIRGDSQTYTLTFKQSDGTVYNIKNWAVFFTVKTNWELADSEKSVQVITTTFAGTTGSAAAGIAIINLVPTDTVDLEPGEYDYDIAVRTNNNETYTVLRGKLDIEYDVTRTAGTAGTAL